MSTKRLIKTGVIGVGHLGQHHARVASEIHESALQGIADNESSRVEKVAAQCHTTPYVDYRKLLEKIEAVVIATPTPFHYPIAKECLNRGIHCLIEKPLCETVEQAEELIQIARSKNLILQVGHIERFNPAVVEARKYIKKPLFIEVSRLGPYNPRVSHIGVVLDLMIHDLDIVLSLVNSKVKNLEAFGAKVLSQHEDIVKCRLRFENQCIVDLSTSRISMEQYRKIRIFQTDAVISIDYAHKDLKVYRKKTPHVESLNDIEIIRPTLQITEPLKVEQMHFLECILEGKEPLVTGEHGRNALELGLEILEQIQLHVPTQS